MRDDQPPEVGYGKPPVKNRFQKGRSGNPSGRPKKKPASETSVADTIRQELDAKMVVQVNGGKVHLTVREIIAKNVINKAIRGDVTATRMVLNLDSANSNERSKAEADLRDYELPEDLIQDVSEDYLTRRSLARGRQEAEAQENARRESKEAEKAHDDP